MRRIWSVWGHRPIVWMLLSVRTPGKIGPYCDKVPSCDFENDSKTFITILLWADMRRVTWGSGLILHDVGNVATASGRRWNPELGEFSTLKSHFPSLLNDRISVETKHREIRNIVEGSAETFPESKRMTKRGRKTFNTSPFENLSPLFHLFRQSEPRPLETPSLSPSRFCSQPQLTNVPCPPTRQHVINWRNYCRAQGTYGVCGRHEAGDIL